MNQVNKLRQNRELIIEMKSEMKQINKIHAYYSTKFFKTIRKLITRPEIHEKSTKESDAHFQFQRFSRIYSLKKGL